MSALDELVDAAVAAGLAHKLPWWRVGVIVGHVVVVDQLRERGYVEPLAREPEEAA